MASLDQYRYAPHSIEWVTDVITGHAMPTIKFAQDPVLRGVLQVTVHEVNGLKGDTERSVELKIGTTKVQTDPVQIDENGGVFKQTLTLPVHGTDATVRIKLFNTGGLTRQEVGVCRVPLSSIVQLHGLHHVKKSKTKKTGGHERRYSVKNRDDPVVVRTPAQDGSVRRIVPSTSNTSLNSNPKDDDPPDDMTMADFLKELALENEKKERDEKHKGIEGWFQLQKGNEIGARVLLTCDFTPRDYADLYRNAKGQVIEAPEATRVFGVSLERAIALSESIYPRVVVEAVEYVREHGLDEVGLFRVTGNNDELRSIQCAYDRDDDVEFESVHDACGLLKRYLRALPEPIIPDNLQPEFLIVARSDEAPPAEQHLKLRAALKKVPTSSHDVLLYVLGLMVEIADRPENKMDSKNLGVCLAPSLFRPSMDEMDHNTLKKEMELGAEVVKLLIDGFETVFDAKVEIVGGNDDAKAAPKPSAAASSSTAADEATTSPTSSPGKKKTKKKKFEGVKSKINMGSPAKRKSLKKKKKAVPGN